MPPRCRVTFFDEFHQLRRTLEVEAALPFAAAEIALRKLIESHISPENLAPAVRVEVITTTEHAIPLRALGHPIVSANKAKVA